MIQKKDRKFMNDARHIAGNSKCRRAQFGCYIVRPENGRPVSSACNGKPAGSCNDHICYREGLQPNAPKRNCCIHSESNAITFSSPLDREGATMYVTGMPCEDCAILIMQSGITRLVYLAVENGSHPGWVGEPVEEVFRQYGFLGEQMFGRRIEVVRYTDAEWENRFGDPTILHAMGRAIGEEWNQPVELTPMQTDPAAAKESAFIQPPVEIEIKGLDALRAAMQFAREKRFTSEPW